MSFKKFASAEFLGICSQGNWTKISKTAANSYFMDLPTINLEERLEAVADAYKISKDPKDYLLIPARANSIGRFNANLDGWTYPEIVSFRPELGCRTYATYNNKPHFVEHNSSKFEVSRGLILDSHLNMENDASDEVKHQVSRTIGMVPDKDAFVEVIVAMDQTKDPILANAYKTGAITTFSMGADVESTTCNICGNEANTLWQFCDHVRDKYSGKEYRMDDGTYRVAGELCNGTIFQELSVVSDPADKSAIIQEGLLEPIVKAATNVDNNDIREIVAFTAKFSRDIPDSLAKVIFDYLSKK